METPGDFPFLETEVNTGRKKKYKGGVEGGRGRKTILEVEVEVEKEKEREKKKETRGSMRDRQERKGRAEGRKEEEGRARRIAPAGTNGFSFIRKEG